MPASKVEQALPPPTLDVGQAVSGSLPAIDTDSVLRLPGSSGDAMSVGTVIASWQFSRAEDTDYDGWPEGWQRKRDRDHPPYLPMKLVANDADMMQSAQSADLRTLASMAACTKGDTEVAIAAAFAVGP
jgi:hypothetical protein